MTALHRHSNAELAAMILAIGAAIVVAAAVVYNTRQASLPVDLTDKQAQPQKPGVTATLTSGDRTVGRQWPALNFTIQPGQSIDPELPAGPFEGRFTLTFARGKARYASIGAIMQGGSLIIMRDDQVLLSDFAGPESPKTVLSRDQIGPLKQVEQVVFIFKSEGTGPVKLQAIWQPDFAVEPAPLPTTE